MSLKQTIDEKLATLAETEFTYIETADINRAGELDLGCTGIYTEATVIYFEIKNLALLIRENGRRKAAMAYTMIREAIGAIAETDGGFVNCHSSDAFLVIYPGKETNTTNAIKSALKIASVLNYATKTKFGNIVGLEFAMGIDHGHIMGTKTLSDNGLDKLTWFGSCIIKARTISHECSRPYHVGVSSIIYHNFDDEMLYATKRILGIKKRVEIWNKISYQYENNKKHLYQTNHKIDIDEAE